MVELSAVNRSVVGSNPTLGATINKKNMVRFKKFVAENLNVNSVDVILMGGLDYRSGDRNINQQVQLLRSGGSGRNVAGFRYNDFAGVKRSVLESPDAYVVLFSAGGAYASEIAKLMRDKSKLFVVEPYASSGNTVSSIRNAVAAGVPGSNIIAGPTKGRGLGAVNNSTRTPKGVDHWGALQYIGSQF